MRVSSIMRKQKKIVDWLVGEDGSACSRVNYFSLASTEIAIDVCFKAIHILKNGNTSDFERAKKLTEYALTTFKLEDLKKKNLQQSLGELLELSDDGESTISHAKKLYWEAGAKSHIRFLAIEEATKKIVQPNEPYSTEGREASSEKQLSPEGRALFLQFVKEKEDQAPKPRKRPLVYFSNILCHKSLIHSFCSSNQFAELSVEQQVLFMRQVGSTSLHTAIEALENPDLIEQLIRKSPQNLLARDFQQNTPIEIARQFHYKASDINRWIGLQNQYLGGFTKP